MQFITTTNLRTQSSELIETLNKGDSVTLIHRSKPIALIQSLQSDATQPKKINVDSIIRAVNALNRPSLTIKEIDRLYRKAMMEKHGKHLS